MNIEKIKETEQKFLDYAQKIAHYEEAVGLMTWDLRTGAPKKGIARRGEAVGTLSSEIFHMNTSDMMKGFLSELKKPAAWENIQEVTRQALIECEENLKKFENVPPEEFKAYVILTARSEAAWEEAKETGDFQTMLPYLEQIIAYQRKYAGWKGFKDHPYNALLDDYEPGLTVETVDAVFSRLKQAIVPLVEKIQVDGAAPETDFLFHPFPAEKQEAFSRKVLKSMGYDFDAGRLDTTVHPFAVGLNTGDVRVTTKYDEKDFRTAVFGTIHEGGHALYEQNISPEFDGTPLSAGASMGVHESQSLFWENFVGRHFNFWKKHYPVLRDYSTGQFDNVSLEEFYRGINAAGPSLIRIEADELTYCLHIILRYELEKALINGEMEAADLPEAWNDKMEELFGIRPSHDGEGVLQDVHWPGGAFGYFPSYALGYVYAAQLKHAMIQDLPDFDELLEEGRLAPVKDWLTENVHKHGKAKKPLDIIQKATGENVNADYLIQYLTDKYSDVYKL
ncbi:MAG: carboxypeptidase M32 [Alkalicoccus sp.]|nr:MAG: carboxypeptidase M32 [Alkalicoccus sp.]